jgi:hypothetical protein
LNSFQNLTLLLTLLSLFSLLCSHLSSLSPAAHTFPPQLISFLHRLHSLIHTHGRTGADKVAIPIHVVNAADCCVLDREGGKKRENRSENAVVVVKERCRCEIICSSDAIFRQTTVNQQVAQCTKHRQQRHNTVSNRSPVGQNLCSGFTQGAGKAACLRLL